MEYGWFSQDLGTGGIYTKGEMESSDIADERMSATVLVSEVKASEGSQHVASKEVDDGRDARSMQPASRRVRVLRGVH